MTSANETPNAAAAVDLTGDLKGADLRGADLSGADLEGRDLSRARLAGARLFGANLRGATLLEVEAEGAELACADLEGADLRRARLARAGFGRARLAGANLQGAELDGASLTDADLTGALMALASLAGARLGGARLVDADLSRATLQDADLGGVDVRDASFKGADLRRARLSGTRGFRRADWIECDVRDVDPVGSALLKEVVADQNFLHEFRHQSRWSELVYRVWWLTSDCGRSALRWGACSVLITLLFAGVYTFVDVDFGDEPTAIAPLYFSVVTLSTLGFGDITPVSAAAQVAVIAEVIVGYTMLGGLMSLLSAKLARRAS